jgi:regulator of sigma E protease
LSYRVQYTGWEGARRGVASTVDMVGLYYTFFWGLVTDFSQSISQVSGPVAIIQATGDAAQRGLDQLLSLAVMLNVALMVFNLLPIPVLDGGMVMLSVIEGIRRRPMADRGLTVYQGVGLSIIGALLIFVLINDPMRIVKRQQAVDRVTSSPTGSP